MQMMHKTHPVTGTVCMGTAARVPGSIVPVSYTHLVEDVVFANDFMPMICDTREDPERERRLLENAIAQRVDGVILGPTNAGWENTALLRKMNIPYVVIGREIAPRRDGEQNDSYFAGDDSYQAGFLAGQCLAQNGHRRIGVVEWNGRVSSAVERDLGLDVYKRQAFHRGGRVTGNFPRAAHGGGEKL